MKINLKARFNNKVFIISASALVVSFLYQMFSAFDIVPRITENEIMSLITMGVNILAFLGVVVDPTTEGINDSERAMTYCTDCDVRKSEEVKK